MILPNSEPELSLAPAPIARTFGEVNTDEDAEVDNEQAIPSDLILDIREAPASIDRIGPPNRMVVILQEVMGYHWHIVL
jgi:hypothetical protein